MALSRAKTLAGLSLAAPLTETRLHAHLRALAWDRAARATESQKKPLAFPAPAATMPSATPRPTRQKDGHMARIPWEQDRDSGDLAPGEYLAEIVRAEERASNGGLAMFDMSFETRGDGPSSYLCNDYLMLEGGGVNIGLAKLKALGFSRDHGTIEAGSLIGRRVRLVVVVEEFNGRRQLKPDINAPGTRCGYLAVEQPAPGAAPMTAAAQSEDGSTEDVPF